MNLSSAGGNELLWGPIWQGGSGGGDGGENGGGDVWKEPRFGLWVCGEQYSSL